MTKSQKTLYLDMTLGVSGDMFSAACYSLMGDALKKDFVLRLRRSCEELDGRIELSERSQGPMKGHSIGYDFPQKTKPTSATQASERLSRIIRCLELSPYGEEFAKAVFSDLIVAESEVHGVGIDSVHLHEIGRTAGLFNIASAGLCGDLLALERRGVVGSPISIGKGEVATAHGVLRVPAPSSTILLSGLKSRTGPFHGEMATPTGIAIAKNLIDRQVERLPTPGKQGIGFGNKSFEGVVGYIRLFEKAEPGKE